MFEVGKKYKKNNSTTVYECIGIHPFRVNQQAGVMRFSGRDDNPEDKGDIPHVYAWDYTWAECKNPVVNKCIRKVYLSVVDARPVALTSGRVDDHIGEIEFTMTDGKLTDVRIIE